MVVEVVIQGQRMLCDPGFGMSLLRPIPMVDGAEDDYLPGWRYRLHRTDAGDWALFRRREEGWELAHTTDELKVSPVDVVIGHHYTSTFPGSHFTTGLILTKHLPGRHVTVTHESLTIRKPGEPTEHRKLHEGEIEEWVTTLDVPLTLEEQSQLHTKVRALAAS
jgi:arylamine N-acetyltransferase